MPEITYAIGNCHSEIGGAFLKIEEILNGLNIPKEYYQKIDEIRWDLDLNIESIIENDVDNDPVNFEDLDSEDMEEELKERGYFVLRATSLNERYKVEAFLEALKKNPYGPMKIM